MLLSETLVKFYVTQENEEKVITYFTEMPVGGSLELGKIAVDLTFDTSDSLKVLQLFVTPHIHNALLESIIPFVEKIAPHMEPDMQASLANWVTQANSILSRPT